MIKNKILLFVLLNTFIFAFDDEIKDNNITENIIVSSSYGEKTIDEQKLNSQDLNYKNKNSYYRETILNWHNYLADLNPRSKDVAGIATNLVIPVAINENNNTKQQIKQKELVSIKGFCFINEDINVGKQPSSLRVDCQTNIGAIILFANLINVNEKASLIVEPKYIEKQGVRFIVENSVVTNETKTSYNVATYVNDRKIAEIGWNATSVSSDELKSATNEYLRALEQSKEKQETQYVTTQDPAGNSYMSPSTTTNHEKPDPLDYLVKAGVNILASAVKSTAEIFKKDLPYLYQVVGGSKIWIDLKVNKKGEYVK